MKDKLINFIEKLRINHQLISRYDEAATKQAIVLGLLPILGWDVSNIEEVKPEYSVSGMAVDYSLRIANKNKFFIEVKKPGEDLSKHQEQLLKYSFQEGVKLAALTNGITWWFYLPLHEGKWEDRRFYTIDILQQDENEVATKFIEILSKPNIDSDNAIQTADEIHRSQRKKSTIRETLPNAWNKILSESNEILINLISDTTEKLCGFKADHNAIQQFLSEQKEHLFIMEPTVPVESTLQTRQHIRKGQRATKGEMTPYEAFRKPILEAIIDLKGEGKVSEILKLVEIKMKGVLKPIEYEKLPSGQQIRWQNRVQWVRLAMIQDGLLRSDSPNGIWEITDKGTEFYKKNK